VAAIWRIRADTGGTFTDCIGVDPDGDTHRAKVLSSGRLRARITRVADDRITIDAAWLDRAGAVVGMRAGNATVVAIDRDTLILDHPADATPGDIIELAADEPAPILGARILTRTPAGAPLPPMELRMATTRATNALLERATAPTALFVTEGFEDLLAIGDQRRPDIFALGIIKPAPYAQWTFPIPGRIDAQGAEVRSFDEPAARTAAHRARQAGAQVAAICLTHAWRNPAHERRLATILRDAGFDTVIASSDLAPRIGLLRRAQTTVVDAALRPVLAAYLRDIRAAMPAGRLLVMTSAGGLARDADFRPIDGLLSGPAGGVIGARDASRRSGFTRAIAFDMGGTSTDVARIDGDPEYQFEHTVGDARIAAPALAIETVAAGGGSICRLEDGRPLVGPHSAGADPGPACYSAGGPLTVTDINLLLGRLDAAVFETPINAEASRIALEQSIAQGPGTRDQGPDSNAPSHWSPVPDPWSQAEGLLQIANDRMAEAIRAISVRRGYDPGDYALVAFGGAGPQHACDVADLLAIQTVICPPDASLLSAVGLAAARIERFAERQTLHTYDARALATLLTDLEREATDQLRAEGAPAERIAVRRRIVSARYAGQGQTLEIDCAPNDDLPALLRERHEAVFGHAPANRAVEIESARVVVGVDEPAETDAPGPEPAPHDASPAAARPVRFAGAWIDTPVYDRAALAPGATLTGPALIRERRTTTVIPPGWRAAIDSAHAIVLHRDSARATLAAAEARGEAFRRELIANRLSAIAEEMGEMLRRTALSANVKERLDFSCAVLDAAGNLISAAPHIPVHLGALGLCVRLVAQAIDMRPGDIIVTNHPAFGGSHLPDITVITPVFERDALLGYVASRAHHAEIGGVRPGSMPPEARTLAEEGVAIPPMRLFDAGRAQWDDMERLLRNAPHPSRLIDENLADLRAQVAAGRRGESMLQQLHRAVGAEAFNDAAAALQSRSATAVADALERLGDRTLEALEIMDDGARIPVRITVTGRRATIDFTGAAPQREGNLNAPLAVTRSATAYVMRLLAAVPTPLNDGLLEPIDLILPEGSMLNPIFNADPARCCAVAGGNVETSQRITCALLRALNLAADSQGTMNNILFGNERFGFYETLGGGEGATPTRPGASAVHTHMSNTAVTDAEILEQRCPVRVERFAIRRNSRGDGAHPGGDGLLRELTFLEPVSLSVVTQRRTTGAPGAAGGAPGLPGRQRIIRASGEEIVLRSVDGAELQAGDRLIVETPGGGGWGEA
jgi:5-oxoprolinase (ATP-hydrolysing)